MTVSSITQTKAEVQKLIKLYKTLQADANKTTDTEKAASKANQAEKLMLQINTLQAALSKTVQSTKTVTNSAEKTDANKETKRTLSIAEKRIELEKRINRIEDAQQQTRVKIKQLNLAKADLSRLQTEAKKNAALVAKRLNEERATPAHELAKLEEQISVKNTQYQSIKKELDAVRQQTQKDAELLREQRDAAIERQKQLEKEKMNWLRFGNNGSFSKGVLIGLGLGILGIVAFAIVVFKTPLLDGFINQTKDFMECSPSQNTIP